MKSANKLFAASVFAAAATFSVTANATVFSIDYHDQGIWSTYNTEDESYAMKFRSDTGKDGFWLVVTDGDNPKGDGESHAILYGDIKNNLITAYAYNGENSSNSYENNTLLGTYENVFSDGGTDAATGYALTMFNLDVSELNSSVGENFAGLVQGEKTGIWFHQSAGSAFEYGADGSIVDYAFDSQMYLDRANDTSQVRVADICERAPDWYGCAASSQLATAGNGTSSGGGSVPAPGGLAIILLGLAGLGRKLRRTNA